MFEGLTHTKGPIAIPTKAAPCIIENSFARESSSEQSVRYLQKYEQSLHGEKGYVRMNKAVKRDSCSCQTIHSRSYENDGLAEVAYGQFGICQYRTEEFSASLQISQCVTH